MYKFILIMVPKHTSPYVQLLQYISSKQNNKFFQQQLVILEGKASVNQLSLLPLLHPPDLLPTQLRPPVARLTLPHELGSISVHVVNLFHGLHHILLSIQYTIIMVKLQYYGKKVF